MLATFRFRLERLLELRERQADAARKDLADVTQRLLCAQEQHQRIVAEQMSLNRRWHQSRGAFHPQEGVRYQQAITMLLSAQLKSSENVAARQADQLQSKARLDAAVSKLKALEKLRDKARARHAAEQTRQEQATLDEFSTSQTRGKTDAFQAAI